MPSAHCDSSGNSGSGGHNVILGASVVGSPCGQPNNDWGQPILCDWFRGSLDPNSALMFANFYSTLCIQRKYIVILSNILSCWVYVRLSVIKNERNFLNTGNINLVVVDEERETLSNFCATVLITYSYNNESCRYLNSV